MTASVIIFPTVRIERADGKVKSQAIRVTVAGANLKRLYGCANQWGVSIDEAASMLLDQALRPPRRRK